MKRTLIPALILPALFLAACGGNDTNNAGSAASTSKADTAAACTYADSGEPSAKPVKTPSGEAPSGTSTLTLETSAGDIPLQLDADLSPCTVGAISSLAEQGYYDNTICHRVTTSGIYVLQCGDPTGVGTGGPGFQFADEYPVTDTDATGATDLYKAGTLAMANSGPGTNGSQFFLTYEDSPLPPNYTIFGSMTPEGLDVVRKVAAKGAVDGAPDGAPQEEVRITKATISAAQ